MGTKHLVRSVRRISSRTVSDRYGAYVQLRIIAVGIEKLTKATRSKGHARLDVALIIKLRFIRNMILSAMLYEATT